MSDAPRQDSDAVHEYLDGLSAVSRDRIAQAAQALPAGDRERYVALAYRRGMSPLGRAVALSADEAAELERLEARLHDAD